MGVQSICKVSALLALLQANLKHPYARMIAKAPLVQRLALDQLGGSEATLRHLARYEIVADQANQAAMETIHRLRHPGFLQIGSGFSYMPLAMAQESWVTRSMEVDYRAMCGEKAVIENDVCSMSNVMAKISRCRLTDMKDLENSALRKKIAGEFFIGGVTIVTEFDFEWMPDAEKSALAWFGRDLLELVGGGALVNVGVMTYDYLQTLLANDPGLRDVFAALTKDLGFDAGKYFFKNHKEQRVFFERHGFDIEELEIAKTAGDIDVSAPNVAAYADTRILGKVAGQEKKNYTIIVARPKRH